MEEARTHDGRYLSCWLLRSSWKGIVDDEEREVVKRGLNLEARCGICWTSASQGGFSVVCVHLFRAFRLVRL